MSDDKLDLIIAELREQQSARTRALEKIEESKLSASKALQGVEFIQKQLDKHMNDDHRIQEEIREEMRAVRLENQSQHQAGSKKMKTLQMILIGFIVVELLVIGPEKAANMFRVLFEIIL